MSEAGGAAGWAKQYAQDRPGEVDQVGEKAKDLTDGQKADGDRGGKDGGQKQPQ